MESGNSRNTAIRAVNDIWPKSPLLFAEAVLLDSGGGVCSFVCLEKAVDFVMIVLFYMLCVLFLFGVQFFV